MPLVSDAMQPSLQMMTKISWRVSLFMIFRVFIDITV
jgi:hypothetical protein